MNAPLRFHPSAHSVLAQRLRQAVQGEVFFDPATRGRYATDPEYANKLVAVFGQVVAADVKPFM